MGDGYERAHTFNRKPSVRELAGWSLDWLERWAEYTATSATMDTRALAGDFAELRKHVGKLGERIEQLEKGEL